MVRKKIVQKGDNNTVIQDSEVHIKFTIQDEFNELISKGQYAELAERLKFLLDYPEKNIKHPFSPHYKYKPVRIGDTIVLEHEHVTDEAQAKYPLTYRGKFKISDNNVAGKSLTEILEDAYFEQKKIKIDMEFLSAFIGGDEVETPNFDRATEEGEWFIQPKEFPEPLKLKLYSKGEDISILDYLEMAVAGRENDYLILNNSRQENAELLVTLKLQLPNKKNNELEINKSKIELKINSGFEHDVDYIRKLLKCIKMVSGDGIIAFGNLQKNKDFLVSENYSLDEDVNNIESELAFIERLYKIEKHYGVKFIVPEIVPEYFNKEDLDSIQLLEGAIDDKAVIISKLKSMNAVIKEKEGLNEIISVFEKSNIVRDFKIVNLSPSDHIELFGATVPIKKVETIYNSLKLSNIDKIKKKAELMDEGETIRIILEPGDDPIYKEYLYF